jgi:hypothetical protein
MFASREGDVKHPQTSQKGDSAWSGLFRIWVYCTWRLRVAAVAVGPVSESDWLLRISTSPTRCLDPA